MKVRLACTSKRRVPKKGIFWDSTCPISMTSPVLMSFAAFITAAGFWWLAEPRSSWGPHLEGQRCDSGGGDQVGAWASAAALNRSDPASARTVLMSSLPKLSFEPDRVRIRGGWP